MFYEGTCYSVYFDTSVTKLPSCLVIEIIKFQMRRIFQLSLYAFKLAHFVSVAKCFNFQRLFRDFNHLFCRELIKTTSLCYFTCPRLYTNYWQSSRRA